MYLVLGGVLSPGGVLGPGGCLVRGGVWSQGGVCLGVSPPGGWVASQHALR